MMALSKNWNSRKAVIASYHIPILQDLAGQTGIDSLSDAVNYLICEYQKQQQTLHKTTKNISQSDNFEIELGDDLL